MNRSEIRSNFKKKLLGLKWCRNTTRMLTLPISPPPPPKKKRERERELQVGKGLFGVHLVILHFKFPFSKSIKSSTLHIFLSWTYHFKKISPSQNAQKIHPKIYTKRQTFANEISRGIWRCLKRDRHIDRKALLSDLKTAFTFSSVLICHSLSHEFKNASC